MISLCMSMNRMMRRTALLLTIAVVVIFSAVVVMTIRTSKSPPPPGGHENLKAVLDRHATSIMAQRSVVGVGITQMEDGRLGIAINVVGEEAAQTVSALYPTLEGYPVSVIITGEIQAY